VSAQLHVVVPPRLAPGYRLAGAHVEMAEDAAAARGIVADLLAHRAEGVIAIHEAFFADFPSSWRARLEPLLVSIPEGARHEQPGARRERLTRLLQRAIGYHFVFGEEEP